ncbi:MAG: TetR/AcrR family transcriptional regulator [Verrucomicrobiae bacterium]|nr:TetR/AcrR family transcriptional regulator [Verrucomicrobiae bacterium]
MRSEARTRDRILRAALKWFARKGYAGTSIRDVVTTARVSRPVLYYYFGSKAGLYQALVNWAADERLRLMREAVGRGPSLEAQLRELAVTMFEFARGHRELMRLAFATAVAAREEVPDEAKCLEKGFESLAFLEELMRRGQQTGVITRRFDAESLAIGFAGLMHLYVLLHVVKPDVPLDRAVANTVVDVFLKGAASTPDENNPAEKSKDPKSTAKKGGKDCG